MPSRMALIKKTDNKCWRGYGEIEILLRCWWECKMVQLAALENSSAVPQKVQHKSSHIT